MVRKADHNCVPQGGTLAVPGGRVKLPLEIHIRCMPDSTASRMISCVPFDLWLRSKGVARHGPFFGQCLDTLASSSAGLSLVPISARLSPQLLFE